jgi:hypothetical protein
MLWRVGRQHSILRRPRGRLTSIGEQGPVDSIRQPLFQAAQGFLGRLAFGALAPVVGLP